VQLLPSATNRVVADGDRTSCFEIAMKTGRKALIPALIDSGRGGCWYLRMLRPGRVPTLSIVGSRLSWD
jgi:hypothetical protein